MPHRQINRSVKDIISSARHAGRMKLFKPPYPKENQCDVVSAGRRTVCLW